MTKPTAERPAWYESHVATSQPPGFCVRAEWLIRGTMHENCFRLRERQHSLALCRGCGKRADMNPELVGGVRA